MMSDTEQAGFEANAAKDKKVADDRQADQLANKPGRAEYDQWVKGQSGYIGKSKIADWWDNYNKTQEAKGIQQDYVNNPGGSFNIYGNGDQQMQTAANLSQVGAMTGQTIFDAGNQQQDYYNSLQARRNGGDAVANNMKAGRNRSLANVGRQFAGKGVAGGVAAAGMNTAANQADSEINAQMQKNAQANDKELWNYVKRNQKVTGEALAAGQDQGLASSMDTSAAEGAFGTVICTELYSQGLLPYDVYKHDVEAGVRLEAKHPELLRGYRIVAAPIVRGMKKSKKLTNAVAFWAIPWANMMAGKDSLRADIVCILGVPLCYVVGKVAGPKLAVVDV